MAHHQVISRDYPALSNNSTSNLNPPHSLLLSVYSIPDLLMEDNNSPNSKLGKVVISKLLIDAEPPIEGVIGSDGRSIISNDETYEKYVSLVLPIHYSCSLVSCLGFILFDQLCNTYSLSSYYFCFILSYLSIQYRYIDFC